KATQTENVRMVITMNEEYDPPLGERSLFVLKQEWKAEGVEQLRLSTVDLTGVPSLENRASSVYVHCKAGRCRSATLAAAYIVQIHCWGPEEACQMLAPIRPHVIICSTQLETLRRYHQKVCAFDSG
uniref:Tyrosine specific protein phosphatases domain-containing protein n=1 Tax=Oncorhynchus mykiss TaxID=8022 RepID=A0A8C7S3B6_ONCMY